MHPRCIAAVEQAAATLGRKITRAEVMDIESKVREAQKSLATKDLDAWRGMSQDERMKAVGEQLAIEFKSEAARKTANAAKTVVKRATNQAYITEQKARGVPGWRSIQHLLGYIADGKGNNQNIEYRSKAIFAEHVSMLNDFINLEKDASVLGFLLDDSLSKKMAEIIIDGKKAETPEMQRAADAITKALDSIAKTTQEAGGVVKTRKNYLPQLQDMFRVHKAGREAWVADAMNHIDKSTILDIEGNPVKSDAEVLDFLNHAFDNLSTGGMFSEKGVTGSASIANRHNQHRQLHWKNAEGWRVMQEKYGAGTLHEQLIGHIQKMSDEVALMEVFGPNALHEYELLKDFAKQLDRDVDTSKLGSKLNHADKMVNKLAGVNQGITGSFALHKWMTAIRNSQIVSKLGSIITSQLADNGTAIAVTRSMNIPMSSWAEMKARGYTDKQLHRMMASNGIGFEGMIDTISQFADGASNAGWTGAAAKLMMKINLSNLTTKTHRSAIAALVEHHLGSMTREFDWATLPERDRKFYEGHGITELDWKILKAAELDRLAWYVSDQEYFSRKDH
jgi:hypothetical protein